MESISLKDYSDKAYSQILTERNDFVLRCERRYGDDYGGCQEGEENVTTYEEIIPERILVKDGHFAGALIMTDYYPYNGGGDRQYNEVMLLADGSGSPFARDGYSFSNDDHSRWDYTDYYLEKRPE